MLHTDRDFTTWAVQHMTHAACRMQVKQDYGSILIMPSSQQNSQTALTCSCECGLHIQQGLEHIEEAV